MREIAKMGTHSSPKHLVRFASLDGPGLESMAGPVSTIVQEQNWAQKLEGLIAKSSPSRKITIIGIGHPLKSDDYVGSLIARDLEKKIHHSRVVVVDAEQSLENILGKMQEEEPGLLIIVDALDMRQPPGTIQLFDLDQVTDAFFTTHNIPLRLILQSLQNHPTTVLLGIQPGTVEVGGTLSRSVRSARKGIVDAIEEMLERLRRDNNV